MTNVEKADAGANSTEDELPLIQWLGLKSNIIADAVDGQQKFLLRWDFKDGYYYVGPFATSKVASAWAEANDDGDLRWWPVFLDPSLPLPLEPPGAIPALAPDANDRYLNWEEPPADAIGAFHLIMFDWPHLVGPFLCLEDAWAWAQDYLRRTDDEYWWVVWLDDSTTRPRLLTPEQGKGGSDQVFATMGWRRNSW